MENILYSIAGIFIPFLGTTLGAAFVFFMKKEMSDKVKKVIIGFASGVMIAASVWSLILPSIEMAEKQGKVPCVPAAVGFSFGIMFLIIINKVTSKLENKNCKNKLDMLIFSVTLHNVPEGMAVGVCFAGFLAGNTGIALMEAVILSIGIGIQNIPEGAIISMPMKMKGASKTKAFIYGMFSGIVEPIAAIITIMLTNFVVPVLPYLLSFAAGAMIFVVVEELIPEMHENEKSYLGMIGVCAGFVAMMVLDVILG